MTDWGTRQTVLQRVNAFETCASTTAANAQGSTLPALRRFTTCAIGPGSDVEAVFVTPQNGPEFLVSVGCPMPAGEWQGPVSIRRAHPASNVNTVAAMIARHAWTSLPVVGDLELEFYPAVCDLAPRMRRAPRVARLRVAGAASTQLFQMPMRGRIRCSFSIKVVTTDVTNFHADGALVKVGANEGTAALQLANEYPTTGTTTLTQGNTYGVTVESDEIDYVELIGTQATGYIDVVAKARDL